MTQENDINNQNTENDNIDSTHTKQKKPLWRRILRVILIIVGVIVTLNIILLVVVSLPATQRKVTSIAKKEVSKLLDTDIDLSSIHYRLFNRVNIKDLLVPDKQNDTLLYIGELDLRIRPLDFLFKKQITIANLEIDSLYANVYADSTKSPFNFQFIVDKFAQTDSLPKDTASHSDFPKINIDNFDMHNSRLSYNILSVPLADSTKFDASHINLTSFKLGLKAKSIDPENLDVSINYLSAVDNSLLRIVDLRTNVTMKKGLVTADNLYFATPNSFVRPDTLQYNMNTEEFKITLENDSIDLQDIHPFVAGIPTFDKKASLKIDAQGKLPQVKLNKLNITIGSEQVLQSEGSVSSYEDLENLPFNLNIKKLYISEKNLPKFYRLFVEPTSDNKEPPIPEKVSALRFINLKANMSGGFSNLKITSTIQTKPGTIDIKLKGKANETFDDFNINGTISTKRFLLGKYLSNTDLGNLTTEIKLSAKQTEPSNLNVEANGTINQFSFMGNEIINMPFVATYTPKEITFKTDTKQHFGNLKADFWMMQKDFPDINFSLNASNFMLARFVKSELWNKPTLGLNLSGDIKSFNIDDLNAKININDLTIADNDSIFRLPQIKLSAWNDYEGKEKTQNIKIESNIAQASIKGKYKFSTIGQEIEGLLNQSMPILFAKKPARLKNNNDFEYLLKVNNTTKLSEVVKLPIVFQKPLTLSGRVNTVAQQITAVVQMPQASMDSLSLRMGKLSVDVNQQNIDIGSRILLFAGPMKYYFKLDSKGTDNELKNDLIVKSDTATIKVDGNMHLDVLFKKDNKRHLMIESKMSPTIINLNNLLVNILPSSVVYYDDGTVDIDNLGIGIDGQRYFDVNGVISSNLSDSLQIRFINAELGNLLHAFGVEDVKAVANGTIKGTDMLGNPEIYTRNFMMKDIIVYGDSIGDIKASSLWDKNERKLKFMAELEKDNRQVMLTRGLYEPKTGDIDVKINIDKFGLAWLQPMASDFLNKVDGSLSSALEINGTLKYPQTTGYIGFNNLEIGVDYTNVTYNISDTIRITPDQLGLKNLVVKDSEGNSGLVNADITHKGFTDFDLKLSMRARDLMVLNTQNRTDSLFYGKVYTSGNINIAGDKELVKVNMVVNNAKKSMLDVTIPQYAQANDYQNIVYINSTDSANIDKPITKPAPPPFPLDLDINLTLSPTMEFMVIINPDTGDKMRVNGEGNIRFKYNMETDDMSLFGNYIIQGGAVNLNLQGLYKIEFKIMDGSKIEFIGDPLKTKFNVQAYKRVRANLNALDLNASKEFGNSRVYADCILGISGNMDKMNITYNVELIDASDEQESLLRSAMNTSEAKMKQFAYLVATGNFFPVAGDNGTSFSDHMWTSIASSVLSAGLNAILGNALGGNWQMDASITDNETTVTASTNFLNDKLRVTANMGYRDGSDMTSEATLGQSNFIGNFDVEYILSSNVALKVFSHANNQFYRQATTVQGVGITYSKDAASFRQLFQRKRRSRPASNRFRGLPDSVRTDKLRPERRTRLELPDSLKVDIVKPLEVESNTHNELGDGETEYEL